MNPGTRSFVARDLHGPGANTIPALETQNYKSDQRIKMFRRTMSEIFIAGLRIQTKQNYKTQ